MPPQPDYSRAALARFIEFVVVKGLVHPATAQGWRVATSKVLEELSEEEMADVRRIDVDRTFKDFLNRYPGRLSPASVGEYRRRVGRAIEEFTRWMEDPGGYAFRPSGRSPERPRKDGRKRPSGGPTGGVSSVDPNVASEDGTDGTDGVSTGAGSRSGEPNEALFPRGSVPAGHGPGSWRVPHGGDPTRAGPHAPITFDYPLRPDLLAQVMIPRDLSVEEARRMGAFLVTLAADFRPTSP